MLQILGNGGAVDLLCGVVLALNARQSGEAPDRADPAEGFVDVIVIRRIWIGDGHDVVTLMLCLPLVSVANDKAFSLC